jgi:hypothetical protein
VKLLPVDDAKQKTLSDIGKYSSLRKREA